MKRACSYSRDMKLMKSQRVVDRNGAHTSPTIRQDTVNSAALANQCPDCGQSLWHQEGCMLCPACGFSQC